MKPQNKNLDDVVNPAGQLKDLSPVEKIQQKLKEKQQKQQMQMTMDNFNKQQQQPANNVNTNQSRGSAPASRANSAIQGTAGAGRGNTT
jgi:hypothetical protein